MKLAASPGVQLRNCGSLRAATWCSSLGAGARQDEKSGTRKEVRGIIDTIKID